MDFAQLSLVILDISKVCMFLVGMHWSLRHRRLLGVVGFGLLAVAHVVILLAHIGAVANDSTLATIAVNLVVPAIALTVAAYILAPACDEERDRWSMT